MGRYAFGLTQQGSSSYCCVVLVDTCTYPSQLTCRCPCPPVAHLSVRLSVNQKVGGLSPPGTAVGRIPALTPGVRLDDPRDPFQSKDSMILLNKRSTINIIIWLKEGRVRGSRMLPEPLHHSPLIHIYVIYNITQVSCSFSSQNSLRTPCKHPTNFPYHNNLVLRPPLPTKKIP